MRGDGPAPFVAMHYLS